MRRRLPMPSLLLMAIGSVAFSGRAAAQDEPVADTQPPDTQAADTPAADAPQPRYLSVVRAELERLELAPVCEILDENRARCQVRHRTSDAAAAVDVVVLVDETTDTVYVHARVGMAIPDGEDTPAVLRRLGALNWRLLSTKLEWNPSGGAIRLSGLLHTDSNLDRLAFRRLMRLLPRQAEQYAREIDSIQGVGHAY